MMHSKNDSPIPGSATNPVSPTQATLETLVAQLSARVDELEQQLITVNQPISGPIQPIASQPTSRRNLLKRFGLAAAGLGAALNFGPVKAVQADSTGRVSADAISEHGAFGGVFPAARAGFSPGPIAAAANLAAKVTGNLLVTGNLTASSPFLLVPGAPSGITVGTHSQGELFTDTNGELYICKTAGNPGLWTKLTPGGSSGNTTVLLTVPVRLIGPNNSVYGGYPFVNNVTASYFPIAGSWTITNPPGNPGDTISVTIPATATGVIGTVSVINSTATGRLMIFSADAPALPKPDFSSLNFTNDTKVWSSEFTSKLGSIPGGPNAGTKGIAVLSNQATSVAIAIDVVGYMV